MINNFDIQDILEHVEHSCSEELSKEECELVKNWFKMVTYKTALLDLILSGQIEIIGICEGEPIVRALNDQLV